MRLPEIVLSLMKSAALSGGVALSAGCLASNGQAAHTTTMVDPSQPNVVYLVEDPRPAPSAQVVVQQPCVYVPSRQPAVVVQQPSTDPAPPTDPDPCPGCGMG